MVFHLACPPIIHLPICVHMVKPYLAFKAICGPFLEAEVDEEAEEMKLWWKQQATREEKLQLLRPSWAISG